VPSPLLHPFLCSAKLSRLNSLHWIGREDITWQNDNHATKHSLEPNSISRGKAFICFLHGHSYPLNKTFSDPNLQSWPKKVITQESYQGQGKSKVILENQTAFGNPAWTLSIIHIDVVLCKRFLGCIHSTTFLFINTFLSLISIFMGTSATFQYMNIKCGDQIRVIDVSISSPIYHFFILETLKIPSTSYFEIFK
jgi:hypothetical protein